MPLRTRFARGFSPSRWLRRTDGLQQLAQGSNGQEWVLARGFCAYTVLDGAAVPARKRRGFVEMAVSRWSPFADPQSHVEWAGDRAMVWAWSRTQAMGAGSAHDKAQAENALAGALKTLFAVAENYPNLKANENFLHLQQELSDTENKIQAARRFYNGTVRDFNTSIQSFPTSILASTFGFKDREFFDLDETPASREPVKVKF